MPNVSNVLYPSNVLRAAGVFAIILAASIVPEGAGAQVPIGWQSSGTTLQDFTVGFDISRQSGGRLEAGSPEGSGYIAAVVSEPIGVATLTQAIRADDYRGKRVRLSGFVRASTGISSSTTLVLRVEGNGSVLGADWISRTPAVEPAWTSNWMRREIVVDVPNNSTGLRFGFMKQGRGQAWLRNVELEVVGSDVALTGIAHSLPALLGTLAETNGRVADREARYKHLPKQPVNLDFLNTHAPRQ